MIRVLSVGTVLALLVPTSGAVGGEGTTARAPTAFHSFCARSPSECRPHGKQATKMVMTEARWAELRRINMQVNGQIREATDQRATGRSDVWSLPKKGVGDCEDFALLKRHRLMALGWPSSVLLMTVVRDQRNGGHAVLTVSTNDGDYVLDNRRSSIAKAASTGYRFFSRQSASNPRRWVAIPRTGQVPTLTASADTPNRI